ncbi:MAG: hypothetical protein N3G80_01550 [Candidatus Micrarchaeota archaeon]|nr:hypothetical protein [Candidatus Micrarchaeota archaeon]
MDRISSFLLVFGLFLLFFGCASQPPSEAQQTPSNKILSVQDLQTTKEAAPALQFPKNELRGLVTVNYPDGGQDFLVLLPGEKKYLRDNKTIIYLNYITRNDGLYYAQLYINDAKYTLFAGQADFAGLPGSTFDVLMRPYELAAKIKFVGPSKQTDYPAATIGSVFDLGGKQYTLVDLLYGVSSGPKAAIFSDGASLSSMHPTMGSLTREGFEIKINDVFPLSQEAPAKPSPKPNIILPRVPERATAERAFLYINYSDGVIQYAAMEKGEKLVLQNGRTLSLINLDIDYTLASNKAFLEVDKQKFNLRIGEEFSLDGVTITFLDPILPRHNFLASFELRKASGQQIKTFTVLPGNKFEYDGKTCTLEDVYPGLTLQVVSALVSCDKEAFLLMAGQMHKGKNELLILLTVQQRPK